MQDGNEQGNEVENNFGVLKSKKKKQKEQLFS